REAGSPASALGTSPAGAERGPAGTPGSRGRAGRVAPGATEVPSLGASPVERGKGRPGARPRPGATAEPGEGAERVSPPPAAEGRPGARIRPAVTPRPYGPRKGVSPSQFERGGGQGQGGERPPRAGGANEPA